MVNKSKTKRISKKLFKLACQKRCKAMLDAKKRRRLGLFDFEEDFRQDEFGDPWLSCQADVNKLVEVKQSKIKSNDKQAQPAVKKNETICKSNKRNSEITHPVDNQVHPIDDQVKPIDDQVKPIDDQVKPIDDQVKPIGKIGLYNWDVDQPIDIKNEEDQPIDEFYTPIDVKEEDKPIDEMFIDVIKDEEDQSIDEFHKAIKIDVKDSECIPKRNTFSERFYHEITSCPPPVAVAEASCSGCLARGAHEEMAGLLVECFGIEVPGAVLCGACAARLRDALHFKWTVLANQRHFDERQRRTADVSALSLSLVVTPLDRPAEETRCESEQNSDEHSDGFFTSRHNLRPKLKNVEAVKTPKINKNKKTLTPKIYDPEKPAKRKAAKAHYTQLGDNYACNDCEAVVDFDNTATHRYNYHGQAKCPLCAFTFKNKKLLLKHKIEEHGVDDNRCNACDKRFSNMTEHMNSFHKLGIKLNCAECDFECFDKYKLRKHMVSHKPTKDHQCQYCSKKFRHKSNMKFHERIHTGDKRKVCAECGQAFVQKASLNYHMAKYHPSVRF